MDRWNEEEIKKRRLESLAKGREALRLKREHVGTGKNAFAVVPLTKEQVHKSVQQEATNIEHGESAGIQRTPEDKADDGYLSKAVGYATTATYSVLLTFTAIAVSNIVGALVGDLCYYFISPTHTHSSDRRDSPRNVTHGDLYDRAYIAGNTYTREL